MILLRKIKQLFISYPWSIYSQQQMMHDKWSISALITQLLFYTADVSLLSEITLLIVSTVLKAFVWRNPLRFVAFCMANSVSFISILFIVKCWRWNLPLYLATRTDRKFYASIKFNGGIIFSCKIKIRYLRRHLLVFSFSSTFQSNRCIWTDSGLHP